MFMCYWGGGIGHTYMREIKDCFEDMKHEQEGLGAPQAANPLQGKGTSAQESVPGMSGITASVRESVADGDGNNNDHIEEEQEEGEWANASCEDDYLRESEDDNSNDDDCKKITQSTYGLGEYWGVLYRLLFTCHI